MTNDPKLSAMEKRAEELRNELRGVPASKLSMRIDGSVISNQPNDVWINIQLWGKPVRIDFPSLVAFDQSTQKELPVSLQALLLYHLVTSDGSLMQNRWISFAELPGGLFYSQAFQGYTGNELVKAFGQDLFAFSRAATKVGGSIYSPAVGDASYYFQVLPRIPLLIVYWLGDEEFSASAKILFDASASHHLPTDVYAVTGGMLVGKIIKQKNRS